jgi:hypothetical protein
MRRWMIALLVVAAACGSEATPQRQHVETERAEVLGSTREKGGKVVPLEAQAAPIVAANHVVWRRAHVERLYREAAAVIEAVQQAEAAAVAQEAPTPTTAAASSSSVDTSYWSTDEPIPSGWEPGTLNGYPCGGDLPPCHVMRDESGGNPNAVNWGGCNGNNCYGLWQFSGEWDCKLGQRCGIATWTVDEQNAAARALWAGGAGCSNWVTC